ncbi:myocardin-related transcription factor B isoform X2 [Bombina bombina]|nr:myocardin-related transcription factor B isoform X2 [Bombina bombina]XP_053550654.1 myocardin-related transcription factor B isoform X2 [Bombina bombina]
MDHLIAQTMEGDPVTLHQLVPSPHSEAVAHDFQELSLQSVQQLPPLKERKNVLQLRLQQRRTREQLVDQGIMPPLKSPAAFHEQIKSLERARTENFLKHKIRSRPERSELVRMHILEETLAEPSLQATQMKLKRARLADDLNEKIAQRPGPMELVEKNILPVDECLKDVIIVGQASYPEPLDTLSFDEDSSDALSPEQPASQESLGSAASPGEIKTSDSSSPISNITIQCQTVSSPVPEALKPAPATDAVTRSPVSCPVSKPGPTLVKQSQPKNASDKSRSKKSKEPKPRVKKLKYHQYIPPDQKGEKIEPEMDTNYARLLQQQQLFLQLQILSQQQQHYNYQTILPAPLKSLNDKQNGNTISSNVNNNTSVQGMLNRQNSALCKKAGPLPSNLDDMKVAELKMELKLRGLPVSGTKTDLIERLKPYQDLNNNGIPTSNSIAVTTSSSSACNGMEETTVVFTTASLTNATSATPSFSTDTGSAGVVNNHVTVEGINSPLPMSPAPSEQSNFSTEDTNMTDTFAEIITMMSPSQFMNTSPLKMHLNDDSMGNTNSMDLDAAEKDRKLQEKEKQIEELKKKLEQEQKLVEVLKMQLEVEKRGQQQTPSVMLNTDPKQFSAQVKEENSAADCQYSRQPVVSSGHLFGQTCVPANSQNLIANSAVVIKHEVSLAKPEHQNIFPQFYVTSQRQPHTTVVAQPQALLTGPAQLLLPVSIKTTNGVQLSMVQAQPHVTSPAQNLVSTSGSSTTLVQTVQTTSPQKQTSPLTPDTFTSQALNQNQQTMTICPPATTNSVFSFQKHPVTAVSQAISNSKSSNILQPRTHQVTPVQNGPTPLQEQSGSPSQTQQYIVQHCVFNSPTSKSKDPPRYEEAIKQSRNLQTTHTEITNAHSQQMDDLFDILIKSGEISPLIKEEPSPISKMRPVTANVTTMPVNTVVSRPPPQIHVAPPLSLEPTSSLSVSLESQLEAFLDGTMTPGNSIPHLDSNSDREAYSLIDELNNDLIQHPSMLDHDSTPMETSDTPFTANSCLSLDLNDTNLDNMEWLDITMPNSASSLTPLSATIPSMFNTDFLDSNDLHLQWE